MRQEESPETRDVLRWNATYVWIIGGLLTVLLITLSAIISWYVNGVSDRHENFQKQFNTIYDMLAQRGERITKLEVRVEECEKRKP